MKLTIILLIASHSIFADDYTVCRGVNCDQVNVEEQRTGGKLLRLRDDQKSKTNAVQIKDNNRNYLYNGESERTESASFLKLSEISENMCLIDPAKPTVFYKIVELNKESGKVRFVVENEDHQYMLRGNVVFWQSDDSSSFKLLRRWPCNRTPNLSDDAYLKGCLKSGVKLGDIYCNSKSKL